MVNKKLEFRFQLFSDLTSELQKLREDMRRQTASTRKLNRLIQQCPICGKILASMMNLFLQ